MKTVVTPDAGQMGVYSATGAAEVIREAIQQRGRANIVVATGASQFEVLANLIKQPGIDWSCVHAFHLDEYVGIDRSHPASFCGYLKERFVDHVPLASFHYLPGDQDPQQVIQQAGDAISNVEIDVALIGIGENAHLAFNDPPADFETEEPYLVVELDHACRMQQVGEGWFDGLESVPTHAMSMSIKQILKSKAIFCSVPDERKADAVAKTLAGPIDPTVPSTILTTHPNAYLVIDEAAASLIDAASLAEVERVS